MMEFIDRIDFWNGTVPHTHHLRNTEITILRKKLCISFSGNIKDSCNQLYSHICSHEKKLGDLKNINLAQVISSCSHTLKISDTIYLDWENFEEIIEVKLDDFIKNINNFWYPSSDDLSIFDKNCNWVLTIYHYGDVTCSKSTFNN